VLSVVVNGTESTVSVVMRGEEAVRYPTWELCALRDGGSCELMGPKLANAQAYDDAVTKKSRLEMFVWNASIDVKLARGDLQKYEHAGGVQYLSQGEGISSCGVAQVQLQVAEVPLTV
jgi:hypothetical protein